MSSIVSYKFDTRFKAFSVNDECYIIDTLTQFLHRIEDEENLSFYLKKLENKDKGVFESLFKKDYTEEKYDLIELTIPKGNKLSIMVLDMYRILEDNKIPYNGYSHNGANHSLTVYTPKNVLIEIIRNSVRLKQYKFYDEFLNIILEHTKDNKEQQFPNKYVVNWDSVIDSY